jgi:hypothetical protein
MTTRMARCCQPPERYRGASRFGMASAGAVARAVALAWTVALAWAGMLAPAGRCLGADPPATLADVSSSDLATPANGQFVYAIDDTQRTILAIEPLAEGRQRVAVAAAAGDGPRPVAVACLDTNTLVAVCLAGESWSLRTWRVKPDAPADPTQPLQVLDLGAGPGSSASVHVAVNATRRWLAITGLPAPLPPVLRSAIAGIRIGKCSDRGCPQLEPTERPMALAISAADELVLVCRPTTAADQRLSFHDQSGRRLLHLDIDLPGIRDLAFNRDDGSLWAVGGTPGSATHPEGLWRLDAAIRDGLQVVSAVRIADCQAPRALVCPAEKTIIVAAGDAGGRIVRYQPSPSDGTQVQP